MVRCLDMARRLDTASLDIASHLDTASLDTASLDTASIDTASIDTASLDTASRTSYSISMEINMVLLKIQNLKSGSIRRPGYHTTHLEGSLSSGHRHTCTPMFPVSLFIISKIKRGSSSMPVSS